MPKLTNLISVPTMLALLIIPISSTSARGLRESPKRDRVSTTCQGITFPCDVNLSITDVKYLGKVFDRDEVEVSGNFSSASPCFQSQFVGGLQQQQSFQGDFSITVTLTRRLGHVDKGFGNVSVRVGSFSTTVKIPRGTLETNPVTIVARVDMTATLKSSAGARVLGTGTPSLVSGPQTSPTASGNTAQCNPSVTITGLSYAQGSGTQNDTVTVNWTVAPPQSLCFKLTNVTATVKLTRANGSTGTGTSGGNGTATVLVSGSPGNVVSFEVTVFAQAGSSPSITATAQKSITP